MKTKQRVTFKEGKGRQVKLNIILLLIFVHSEYKPECAEDNDDMDHWVHGNGTGTGTKS